MASTVCDTTKRGVARPAIAQGGGRDGRDGDTGSAVAGGRDSLDDAGRGQEVLG
jgi:hypothetical protein